MEIYDIKDLSFAFPLNETNVLSSIHLKVHSGEFITICGKSGCGKSTLLRQLKTVLTPHGKHSGDIFYQGKLIDEVDQRTQASEIGFVLQNPDNQIVTDKVWHELAFGLESLGYDQSTIRLHVAEMASFFGIQTWFHKSVTELSGGQKQLLNLASIMAMHPAVLILDEPTSQLDPIAAADFLETVSKINRELGTTIIMTEHRLEEVLPITDRLIVLDQGKVIADDSPVRVGEVLRSLHHPMFTAMPSPMQIYAGVPSHLECPVTVKQGRQWLSAYMADKTPAQKLEIGARRSGVSSPVAISFKEVWFRHERNGPDTIKDLSFEVREGQFYCMVGGNGTGKTTTLSLINGNFQPYRGKVRIHGDNPAKMKTKELFVNRLGVLPQNPATLFVKKTVELDLYEMLSEANLTKEEKKQKVEAVIQFAELEPLLGMHPYDLSGGEQQRAALAKVLLMEPRILLLDEPTKGLDGFFKEKLGLFLRKLHNEGVTIVMVSHDIEFCAKYGEECAMFFDGSIITSNAAHAFFSGNSFYTTAANRMARHIWSNAVTIEGVIDLCQKSLQLPND
ncbi:ATP-binding cassette domain-containing protein [Paenibacillus alba]|uniref:ABC transporter ATP-binding protein n=1 Tax=Paenibacillus alba TaxID=1197127 RepID=UPI001565231B|nr:ATP-binding cassette domain-containing protein [Paenibacillus alba]NQX66488.1 ATP-binding cassette domain-containing protein [Paenibacillus alba]